MSRNETCALIAAAAAFGLSMTPAVAARLVEPTGYAEMLQLVETHPETDQAIFPGLSAAPLLMGGKKVAAPGAAQWTSAGTYSFIVPQGVSTVCAVAIGGGGSGGRGNYSYGGSGGGGGGLGWRNNIAVTPGEALTIVVGAGGNAVGGNISLSGQRGGDTIISRGATYLLVAGGGGSGSSSGSGGYGGPIQLADGGNAGAQGGTGNAGASNIGSGGGSGGYSAQNVNGSPRGYGALLNGVSTPQSSGIHGGGSLGNTYDSSSDAGAPGGARIIWGAGYFYPGNAVI